MWQVQVVPLGNGMKLYCHPGNTNLSGIGFAAGSIRDPKGKVGLAHYVEHVITGRSERYPDARELDLLMWKYMGGADNNRNIRTDRTSVFYGHGDLLRRKHMLTVFDMMASFVHPKTRIVDPERLLIEAGAVHQEFYLRGKDFIESLLDDLFHRTMYTKNPIRHRVDCEVEDLKSITPQDVERFLRRYYVPKNAFAIILGPKTEDAKAMAERYFADWEGKSTPILDYDHTDDFPELSSVRSFELERAGIGQYHFAIGFPTEGYTSADGAALDVIKDILEYRLNLLLRDGNRDVDKGVYRTPTYTERSFVHGFIEATFATTSRSFEARAEDIVLGEFRRLTTELVPHDELETMIEVSRNAYLDAFWNVPLSLSELIIYAATNEDTDLQGLHAYRGEILRINRRKIREVANKYFSKGKNYARVLIKPA